MRKKLKPIPEFKSIEEESDFWNTHDTTDYIDWSKAEFVQFPNLKQSENRDTKSNNAEKPLLGGE